MGRRELFSGVEFIRVVRFGNCRRIYVGRFRVGELVFEERRGGTKIMVIFLKL